MVAGLAAPIDFGAFPSKFTLGSVVLYDAASGGNALLYHAYSRWIDADAPLEIDKLDVSIS
jgi:hypothetical protein